MCQGARRQKRGMGAPHAAHALPLVPPWRPAPGGHLRDTVMDRKGAVAPPERLKSAHLAHFGGDGEAGGHVQAQVRHLTEVGALATELQWDGKGRGQEGVSIGAGGAAGRQAGAGRGAPCRVP